MTKLQCSVCTVRRGVRLALTLILRQLERRAAQLGYQLLRLDTTDKQQAVPHLYVSAGYRVVSREPGPGTDENLIYEKGI